MTAIPIDAAAPRRSPRLLVVWWSRTGAAQALAQAAAEGAASEGGVETQLARCDTVGPQALLGCDGLIIVTPEMLGSAAGMMKDFLERSYYPALGRIEARPYALIVSAGSDGRGAAQQIERVTTGWRLRRIADPLIVCTHAQTPEAIEATKTVDESALHRAREIGATLAAGLMLRLW